MAAPQDLISEDNCKRVLRKLFRTSSFTIEKFEVVPFDKPFSGLIGEHYILKVEFEIKSTKFSHNFFIKTMSSNKVMYELTKSICVYEKEKFFYTYLRPEMEEVTHNTDFVPHSYLFLPNLIVLENVSIRGYRGTDKKQPLDLEHCKVCLRVLAQFHANSLIYEKVKSKELGTNFSLLDEHSEILENKFTNPTNINASKYIQSSIEGIFAMITELLSDTDTITKEQYTNSLKEYLEKLNNSDDIPLSPSTILHGDLWSSNFLYLYENEMPVKAILLDYQTISYGPPHTDLLQFIMTNTRKKFRNQYSQMLLEFYYETINDILVNSEYREILQPLDMFMENCESCKIAAKIFAIIDRCITFVADEGYAETIKSEELFRKFLFEDRSNHIIASCKTNKEFRELMTEDILELRDFLFL